MLRDCVPLLIADMKQMAELFEVEQRELDRIDSKLNSLKKELNISSCTLETINRYERDYELSVDMTLNLEQRRARVLGKKYEKLLPKIKTMENMLLQLLGARLVKIIENNCEFQIYVETVTLIDNFDIASQAFRAIRPAHYTFKFINSLPREYEAELFVAPILFKHRKEVLEVKP